MTAIASEDRHWSLDKRVPLALIFAMLMQTAAIVWWAADLSANDHMQDNRIQKLEHEADQQAAALTAIAIRLEKIDGRLETQVQLMQRIEKRLAK